MSDGSEARAQLERSVRAILPRRDDLPAALRDARATTAGIGLGGLLTGYVWGWRRGRRSRRRG